MEPSEFSGKEEDVDTVHPGMKQVLHLAAKANSQLGSRVQLNSTEEEWNLAGTLFTLLKRKTTGEARSLVMSKLGEFW